MVEAPKQPERVLILDTTLRDGAQSPGIALSNEQSLDIAQMLAKLGVDVIEAGFPVSSLGNFKAVQTIAQQVEGPVIAGLATTKKKDIDRAGEALRDAERPRIHTFTPASDIQIEKVLESTRDDVKAQTRAAVAYARSLVDDVEFSPMDATRGDVEFIAEVCEIAIEEGATTINIPDTVGYTTPVEYQKFLGRLYELVPSLGGVILSVHCHDDLGLAVANSFAGVQVGGRQVECAINGLGERAGNASLEEVVMLMRTRRDLGYDTGIETTAIGPTSRMVSSYTGYDVPGNKAIVGANAFQHEAGIHQDGVLKARETFEIMSSKDVGMEVNSITLGKQSGRHAVRAVLEEGGIFKPDYFQATFALFKEAADIIGTIPFEQIVALHEEAERRSTGYYRLEKESFKVSSESGVHSASMEVVQEDGYRQHGSASSEDSSSVDGPVSAIFEAIKAATSTSYHLKDFTFDAIGDSGDQVTIGEAIVKLHVNDTIVTGKGVSNDTNKATALAYLNALSNARSQAQS